MVALKVTEFNAAGGLTGNEILGLVQDDANVQADLDSIAGYVAVFVTGGGATLELIRDTIAAALVAGTGISITVNDGADTITIASTITQYTDEMARDALGTALTAGANVTLTVNDGADTITIAVTTEAIQDIIGALISASTGVNGGIVVTYDDAGNAETIGLASSAFQTLTDQANIAWDMSAGYNAKVTLGGARTLTTPTNPVEGRTYSLKVIQDGSGSRTLSWPTAISFGIVGAPTLSTGAGKIDLISLQCLESAGPTFRAVYSGAA